MVVLLGCRTLRTLINEGSLSLCCYGSSKFGLWISALCFPERLGGVENPRCTGMMRAVRLPGFDPGSVGAEANYVAPTSFTMDSGSGAGMTGNLGFRISALHFPE